MTLAPIRRARTAQYDRRMQNIPRRRFIRSLGTLGLAAVVSPSAGTPAALPDAATNRLDGGTPTSVGAAPNRTIYDGGRP